LHGSHGLKGLQKMENLMTIVNLKRITGKLLSAFLITALTGLTGYAQSTYTVSNTDDSGAGSLRQAMLDAEVSAGADIIDATGISGTITLDSALSTITQDLMINGPGAANLSISGANLYRPFFVTGGTVQIKNLSIINGKAQGGSPTVGGGGGAGMGGAIYIDAGSVTLTSVTFSGNSAVGGNSYYADSFGFGVAGGDGPFAGSGGAGGFSTSSNQGGNGGPGSFGGGGGSGGYGRYAGGFGGNGGYGGGAGAVGSKNDPTSGGWSTVNPGSPGEFGGSSTSADFHGNDLTRRSGGGGAGLGGALFARSGSTVSLVSCTFTGNSASGGTAGTGGTAGKGKGGAIFVHPGATIDADLVTFTSNSASDESMSLTDNDDFYGDLNWTAPETITLSASDVSFTTVTLNGTVNPKGSAATFKFQYSTDSTFNAYSESTSGSAGAGTSSVSVSKVVSGLSENTSYYFRLVSESAKGKTLGYPKSFLTLDPPRPVVTLNDATDIGGGMATLNASVNPNGSETTYKFEYSDNPSFTGTKFSDIGSVTSGYYDSNPGNAIQFNGNNYVAIPDNGTLDLPGEFTIEAWIYQYASGENTIIEKGNNRYAFQIKNNKLSFRSESLTASAWVPVAPTRTVPVKEWVHVAVTYSTTYSELRFYMQGGGVEYYTNYPAKPVMTPDNGDINIGLLDPSGCSCSGFNGMIDEVRVWSVARTSIEIQESYRKGMTGSETGLVAYWQFNEIGGETVTDHTGKGNDGITMGSPSFRASGATVNTGSKQVSASIDGLLPKTNYFRVSATNEFGTTVSAAKTIEYKSPSEDLIFWVRADSGVTKDGSDLVSSWTNLAPGGGEVTQSATERQPLWVSNGINGKPVLRFNGTSTAMETPNLTIGTNMTVIAVLNSIRYDNQRILSDENYFTMMFDGFRLFMKGGAGDQWGSGYASFGTIGYETFHIVSVSSDGNTSKGYMDGLNTGSASFFRIPHSAPNYIGASYSAGSGFGEFLQGDVAEMRVYNKALTQAEIFALVSRLKLKYQVGVESTSTTPAVPAGSTGSFVLGSTGAAVTFTTGSGTSGSLTASTSNSPTIVGSLPLGITGLATEKYWSIVNTGLTDIEYSITLDLTGITGISDFNSIKVVKREDENATWVDVTGSPFFATVTYDDPFITINGLTSFSEFAVGSGSENPLPVELSAFAGQISGGKVVLNWSTTTETNNYGWEVEKQKVEDSPSTSLRDQKTEWETIGFVAGKGTTTEAQSYSFSSPVAAGSLKFRLKQIDVDGKTTYSQIVSIEGKPTVLALNQNYPNPFNPTTTIGFALPASGKVNMVVFDILGREVATLLNRELESGFHSVVFDASSYAAGVYFYKLTFNGKVVTKKLTLLK